MTRPQAITVATDFSESAQHAVWRAAQLSNEWKVPLTLIHVFNDSAWSSIKAIYDISSWAKADPVVSAQQRLAAICAQLQQDYDLKVDAHVLIGRASLEIQEFVASRQGEMLVVGEHGENWIRDAVIGGTALRVIEHSNVPVLLVRQHSADPYQRILIATDFSESAARAVQLAMSLFPVAGHYLIHAYGVPFETSMRMGGADEADIQRYREQEHLAAIHNLDAFQVKSGFQDANTLTSFALHGYPASVILEQAKGMEADLITMGRHSGGALEEKLLGSVTQNILYHAECDVLISP